MTAAQGARSAAGPVVAVGGVVLVSGALAPTGAARGVVLVRRGRPPMAGRWSLPGGRLERGETLAAGVAREVLEETGLIVRVGPLVEVFEVIEDPHHYVILDYACELVGGRLQAGDDAEAVAVAALSDEGAPGLEVVGLEQFAVSEAVARVVSRAAALQHSGRVW
jgi:ADP-ribose pyrophosphatase YjhB (NUDIX family)